jgi:ArsR family transcriptional regulator
MQGVGFAMKLAALANLEANAPDIARMLSVLANKERVRILYRLASSKGELPTAALAAGTQISQSALSQHLTKLRKRGIISARRAGHNSFYRLADPRAEQIVNALPEFFQVRSDETIRSRSGGVAPTTLRRNSD